LFPSKKKAGVLHKTKEAFEIVNWKLKQKAKTGKGGIVDMMPFENDSNSDFNPEEDVSKVFYPFKYDVPNKLEEKKNENRKYTGSDIQVKASVIERKDDRDVNNESEINEGQASPRAMTSKKHARGIARSSRSRRTSTIQSHRAKSSGCVLQHKELTSYSSSFSNKPSSARLRRHISVPVPSTQQKGGATSPVLSRTHFVTPTLAPKEMVAPDDLPEMPSLTPETEQEDAFRTPRHEVEGADTSWKRVSHAFEDDVGAVGGYCAKLLEKMEVDESHDAKDRQSTHVASDNEDQKKVAKSKTAMRIRKLFARGRSPRGNSLSEKSGVTDEVEDVPDMALFTTFISSPIPVGSPKTSDNKCLLHPCGDGCGSKSVDILHFTLGRHTGCYGLPGEDNLQLPSDTTEQLETSSTPKTIQSRCSIRQSSTDHGLRSSDTRHKGGVIKDPGCPGKLNLAQLRAVKYGSPDSPLNVVEDGIPIRIIGSRRTQKILRTPEKRATDNEQLWRSSHRLRRTRGSTPRGSSQHPVKPETLLDLQGSTCLVHDSISGEQEKPISWPFGGSFHPSTEKHDYNAMTKQGYLPNECTPAFDKGHVQSRMKRVSSGRIASRGVGSHSSHGRRNKTSGTRKQKRPNLERAPQKSSDSDDVKESLCQRFITDQHSGSCPSPAINPSLSVQRLGGEPLSPSMSRRTRPNQVLRQAILMRSSSLSNVHNGNFNSRDFKNPNSVRLKRLSSEGKQCSVTETDESSSTPIEGDVVDKDTDCPPFQRGETPLNLLRQKAPSLTESLKKGSKLNIRLFDEDGQETVGTDDNSLWLEQGSVTGLEIKSSASVAAPQLVFDHTMSRIVE
jgi:hypothetical protein